MRDHQIERRTTHSLGASVSDYTHPINESSALDADADGEDVSILSGQSIVNRITTTDLVFNQPQTNTQHYSHPQLPRVVLRQASPEEKDNNNNITTTVSYGSFHDPPSGLFTTPLAANSLAGSLDGTSDDTNILARSAIEGITDMKTDDIIEPSHAALPHESDQANILNRTTKTD